MVTLFRLDKYPEVGLLGNMIVLFLTFSGTRMLFSVGAASIHLPPMVHKVSLSCTSVPPFMISFLLLLIWIFYFFVIALFCLLGHSFIASFTI